MVFEDIIDDDVETDEGIIEDNEFNDVVDGSVALVVDVDSDKLLSKDDDDEDVDVPDPDIVVVVPDETTIFEDIFDEDVETDEGIVEEKEFDVDIDVSVP